MRTLLILGVTAGLALAAGAAGPAKPRAILAHGDYPLPVYGFPPPRNNQHQWVIRSNAELVRLAGDRGQLVLARELNAEIDFTRHTLLAVSGGMQPLVGVSGGGPPSALYAVTITRISRDTQTNTLTVDWQLVPRDPKVIVTDPVEVVLIERFDGAVKFNRLPPRDKDKPPPTDAGGVKVLARTFWPDGWKTSNPAQAWVIRDRDELIDPRLRAPEPVLEKMRQEAEAKLAKALKVNAIDFTRQMVVGVSAGVQPTAGARVAITKVETDAAGQTMTVHWELHAPKPGTAAPARLTHPGAVALVDRFSGTVRFHPPPPGPVRFGMPVGRE
jgi:hypothetical protein